MAEGLCVGGPLHGEVVKWTPALEGKRATEGRYYWQPSCLFGYNMRVWLHSSLGRAEDRWRLESELLLTALARRLLSGTS